MKFNYNPEYTPNPVAKLIDFDAVSAYVCPVKPLEIKETFMTARTIEIGKTYKLVETEIKTTELDLSYKALVNAFGEGEFVVKSFSKSNWYDKNKAYVIRAHRLDNDEVIKTIVFEAELILFQECDPTDLLTRAVAIKTPFISVCGWVTDQWIEDGVELLNVVHAGDFSVVPRSAVVAILN